MARLAWSSSWNVIGALSGFSKAWGIKAIDFLPIGFIIFDPNCNFPVLPVSFFRTEGFWEGTGGGGGGGRDPFPPGGGGGGGISTPLGVNPISFPSIIEALVAGIRLTGLGGGLLIDSFDSSLSSPITTSKVIKLRIIY